MFLKSMVGNLRTLRQVHLIMQAHKYGEINLMITKVIFGHLDVYYMNLQALNLLFRRKIWINYLKIYKETRILLFHISIL